MSPNLSYRRSLSRQFIQPCTLSTEWPRVRPVSGGEAKKEEGRATWAQPGISALKASKTQKCFQGIFTAETPPSLCDGCHFPTWTQTHRSPIKLGPKDPRANKCFLSSSPGLPNKLHRFIPLTLIPCSTPNLIIPLLPKEGPPRPLVYLCTISDRACSEAQKVSGRCTVPTYSVL